MSSELNPTSGAASAGKDRYSHPTHGGWINHRSTYQTWQGMKYRCHNPTSAKYKNYGARGIIVCSRWLASFENFLADMGPKPDGLTIERNDNNGNYEPGNCRWATRQEQTLNYRCNVLITRDGITKPLGEWAALFGIPRTTALGRRYRGWPESRLFEPVNKSYSRIR